MKNITRNMTLTIIISFFAATPVLAQGNSGQAAAHSGQAASHASAGALHGVLATGQVTSGASAVPLAVSGAAGTVSGEISKELMEAASTPIGTPLEITEETVTAGPPPNEALKSKNPQ